ncbi:TylF/MycF/NovP-related O-methyltransferase [Nocardioides lijunqiniae]|uniref:TylF/MycF/NovP-related O-methyltransferase n=1 Tax=Nocardioides lijunqiniae TaxID=2760832 RepID=UPI0018778C5D
MTAAPAQETTERDPVATARALYLDLIQRVLVNSIYEDPGMLYPDGATREEIAQHRETVAFDRKRRLNGFDFPSQAHTMIGTRRMDNLRECVETVLADDVPGDLMETGVWRGGATIFMRAILKAHDVTDRTVWVADSFEGLPPADAEAYPIDAGIPFDAMTDVLGVSLEQVQENFRRYDLLDEQVHFLKGFFRDTLPGAPVERLAVLRLDGDMYESTINALDSLYPRLSPGGFLIIDDYRLVPACRQAVTDYRATHGITTTITAIDACGSFWRKEDDAGSSRARGLA